MSELDRIFRAFVDSYRGDPSTDPRQYLEQVEGMDREELRLRIEAFLEKTPSRRWDPEAYPGSMAERAIAAVSPEFEPTAPEGAEGWPQLLPALRQSARLKRAAVVERLAAALGFPESEERVAAYYHRMEQGLLRPSGVSSRVLEALGSILGTSAAALRRAGAAGEQAAGGGGEVFARLGAPSEGMASPGLADRDIAAADRPAEPDELDLLFIGGD